MRPNLELLTLFYKNKILFNRIAVTFYLLHILLFLLLLQNLSFAEVIILLVCVHLIPVTIWLNYSRKHDIAISVLNILSGLFVFLVVLFEHENVFIVDLIYFQVFVSMVFAIIIPNKAIIAAFVINIIFWVLCKYFQVLEADTIMAARPTLIQWQVGIWVLKMAYMFFVFNIMNRLYRIYMDYALRKDEILMTTQEKLEEKIMQITYLAKNNNMIFFSMDNKGVYTEAFGKEFIPNIISNLIGRSAFEHYKDNQEAIAMLGKAFAGQAFRASISDKNKYYEVSWLPILDNNNHIKNVSGFTVDMTQWLGSEHKNQLLSFITDKISDAVVITDIDNNIEWINNAYTQMTGFTIDDVRGRKNDFSEMLEEDLPIYALIEEALKMQKSIEIEFRKRNKNNDIYWVSMSLTPMFDEKGHLSHNIIIETDITTQKETEQKLRYNSLLFETVFNTIDDFVAIATPEGGLQVLKANERAVELLELSNEDELLNRHGFIWRKQPLSIGDIELRNKAIDNVGYWKEEVEYQTKNGNFFWGQLTIQRFKVEGNILDLIKITDISGQIKIRKEIEEQKLFHDKIINAIPIKIVVMDKDGNYKFINKQCFMANEEFREKLIGENDAYILELTDDVEIRRRAINRWRVIQQAIAERNIVEVEERNTDFYTGKDIVEMNRIIPLYDDSGNPTMIIGYALDITNRKEYENSIEKQRHFFNTILNNIPLQIIVLSKEQRYLYINKEAVKNEEYRKWAIGKTIQEYAEYRKVSPVIMQQRMGLINKAIETRDLSIVEEYYNDLVFIRYMIPIMNEYDEVEFMVSYGVDITERMLAQRAVQYNEVLFETTFNEAADFIAHIDLNTGDVTRVNNSGCSLFEAKNAQEFMANSRRCLSEILPIIHEIFSNLDEESVDFFWTSEAEYTTLKGNKFWGAAAVKHFYMNKERFGLVRISNITSRKEAEQQLEKYAIELQKANSELERSNRDLEQFAYVASHDLKTPLRNINGFLTLLEKYHIQHISEGGADLVKSAIKSVSFLEKLINGLLEYSQVDKKRNIQKEVDLNNVIELIKHNFRETNATIQCPSMPIIYANFTQMSQLFQNLIGNGIKYNQSEKPLITIDFHESNGFYVFKITDNGIGIEEEYQESVFTIFRRLHTQQEYEGTGIGLSICKKVVEGYGGQIWLESQKGKGTTFYFTLPMKPPEKY